MKNVMIYNVLPDKIRYDQNELYRYFKAQIDNSLARAWNPGDIILGTNFDFEYRGVRNVELKDVCQVNPFYNKFFGLLELFNLDVLGDDDIWFHDQDNWQVSDITFPDFEGYVGGCEYVITKEWNTGSLFFKKTSKVLLDFIVSFLKLLENTKVASDENVIAYFRGNSVLKKHFSTIDTRYNVGQTGLKKRYDAALLPVCVIGVKPTDYLDVLKFRELNLVDSILDKVFSSI